LLPSDAVFASLIVVFGAWLTLLLALENWWSFPLFLAILAVGLLVCREIAPGKPHKARKMIDALICANLLFALGGALPVWNTHDRVRDVLVCDVGSSSSSTSLYTNEGRLHLDEGIYNGTYYDPGYGYYSDDVTKSLRDHWVRVTVHGHLSAQSSVSAQYVTAAETLRPGACRSS
jgi:hypothetical protein